MDGCKYIKGEFFSKLPTSITSLSLISLEGLTDESFQNFPSTIQDLEIYCYGENGKTKFLNYLPSNLISLKIYGLNNVSKDIKQFKKRVKSY